MNSKIRKARIAATYVKKRKRKKKKKKKGICLAFSLELQQEKLSWELLLLVPL